MKELKLTASIANIPQVTGFVEGELEALGCPMKTQMQIDVAVDEVFTNIASYAYGPGQGDATVRFEADKEKGMVSITFMDTGHPFNPLKQKDPDVTAPADKRPIGGLGIFLVKKTMDQVEYKYEDGMNKLTIRKKLNA